MNTMQITDTIQNRLASPVQSVVFAYEDSFVKEALVQTELGRYVYSVDRSGTVTLEEYDRPLPKRSDNAAW